MEWPLMSECVGREKIISIMNDKTPNKHFFSIGRSYSYDDQKNEWREFSDNFYFLEEGDGETYYFNADSKKIFYNLNE